MPKVIRSMLEDDGKPKVGSEGKTLGVRLAPDPRPDISVDEDGNVHPRTGGMSVAPEWRKLPSFLIPKRLRALVPDACGSNKLNIWSLGGGTFEAGTLAADLDLRPDPDDPTVHGFIEPTHSMSMLGYQQALADTQGHWVKVEAST